MSKVSVVGYSERGLVNALVRHLVAIQNPTANRCPVLHVLVQAEPAQLSAERVVVTEGGNVDDQVDIVGGTRGAGRGVGDQKAPDHAAHKDDAISEWL